MSLSLIVFGAACTKKTVTTVNTAVTNITTTNSTNTVVTDTFNSVDPCTLLTQAEAEAVFGRAGKAPAPNGTACRYDTSDSTKFFDLTAKAGTTADYQSMKNLCDASSGPVAGLGDSSCSANNTVVVLRNASLMTLIAGGVFDQAQLQNLAVTAAGRLP